MKPAPRTRSMILLLALATAVLATSSCRTTKGFGQDVKKLGGEIEQAAARHD